MRNHNKLEQRIREIAAGLFTSMREDVPSIFNRKRWIGKLMEYAMRDDAFKTQLFRFIDVLPALKRDTLVLKLFNEYFTPEIKSPPIIRHGIERLSLGYIPSVVADRVIRASVKTIARQFISGRDPKDALRSFEALKKEGALLSVDLLGEVVVSDAEAMEYRERYLELLAYIGPFIENDGMLDISLKVSSFYSQMNPLNWEGSIKRTKNSLLPVFEKAKTLGVSITFDMEHYYLKDLTIEIFKSILQEFKNSFSAGIALQAYLKDSKEDLLRLIEWAKKNRRRITIRLVKGAYWDHELIINRQKGWPVPVFLSKAETDRNYEELTGILLENTGTVYPAIATHNVRSIGNALVLAEQMKLPERAIEFQTLYGMGEPVRRALKGVPYKVRVYCPVGELLPGMAYLVRRLLENTSNESFLRKSLAGEFLFEDMVRAPETKKVPNETHLEQDFENEPSTDFSKEENRQKMKDALGAVKEVLNHRYPLSIGNKEVYTEMETLSINPARPDEVIGRVSSATKGEAEMAVEEARNVWDAWRKTLPEERAGCLFRAAREMRKRRFELAAIEVYEVGKTWVEADSDVAEAIDYLEYYGLEMLRLSKPRHLGNYPGEENEYLYEPRGVGVVISPWNFPLAIPTGMASAGIVTGNCVILKPSGLSPVVAWQLMDIFRISGLPAGVLQYLPGSGAEVGEHLVSHKGIDFIAFTGSRDVGLRILKLSGVAHTGQRSVKKVIAEMGGKNAIIVDATADLDEALRGVLESALGYQGQKCSACSRVVVINDVFDEFCRRLKEAMKSIEIGPPDDPATFMGPLVNREALRKVKGYIEKGKEEGEVVLLRETNMGGYYIGPAMFNVSGESTVAREEIFGPVIAVIKAVDIDDAISIANSTPYALTGGLFSRSPANIDRVRDDFMVGNLYINRKITSALVGRQPFGGFGMSGIGSKAGGPDYLLQFMNPKSISENTMRRGFAPETLQ